MFRRQTDEVFSTLQQVQRRLSQHTDGSAPDDVVSPTIRRVTNPTDGRKAPPPSSAAPRSATQAGSRKSSQYGSKFQVNAGSADQPAHVVPVIDRSNMANTGKVLNEQGQGIAQEYAPLPTAQQARPAGIVIRPPTALLLAVLFLGSVVGAYSIGRVSTVPPSQSIALAGPAHPDVSQRSPQQIQEQQELITRRDDTEAQLVNPNNAPPRNAAIQPRGDYVLVLESYTQNTPEKMKRMQDLAKRYNKLARDYVNDGYKPWFGVRKPRSGGLQLVFGALDGNVFGIPNNDVLAKKMEKDMKRPFPTALWIKIR